MALSEKSFVNELLRLLGTANTGSDFGTVATPFGLLAALFVALPPFPFTLNTTLGAGLTFGVFELCDFTLGLRFFALPPGVLVTRFGTSEAFSL